MSAESAANVTTPVADTTTAADTAPEVSASAAEGEPIQAMVFYGTFLLLNIP